MSRPIDSIQWGHDQGTLYIDDLATLTTETIANRDKLSSLTAATTTITVGVGKEYADLQSALDAIKGKVITSPLTIKVSDGVYAHSSISFSHHPYAHRISIVGNVLNPSACVINIIDDSAGVGHGIIFTHIIGLNFSGFKIVGTGTNTIRGLHVSMHSVIFSDSSSLIIENVTTGVEVYDNSYISAGEMNISLVSWGVVASRTASVHIHGVVISGLNNTQGNGIFCESSIVMCGKSLISIFSNAINATTHGYVWCNGSSINNCSNGLVSVNSDINADINAETTLPVTITNGSTGVLCLDNGKITSNDIVIANFTNTGISATSKGLVTANRAAVTDCPTAYYADSGGLINAFDTLAKIVNVTTTYSPPANGIFGNDGGMIRYT